MFSFFIKQRANAGNVLQNCLPSVHGPALVLTLCDAVTTIMKPTQDEQQMTKTQHFDPYVMTLFEVPIVDVVVYCSYPSRSVRLSYVTQKQLLKELREDGDEMHAGLHWQRGDCWRSVTRQGRKRNCSQIGRPRRKGIDMQFDNFHAHAHLIRTIPLLQTSVQAVDRLSVLGCHNRFFHMMKRDLLVSGRGIFQLHLAWLCIWYLIQRIIRVVSRVRVSKELYVW